MASATSAAASPRLSAFGASFGTRLLLVFLGAAFFLTAMDVSLALVPEDDARAARVREIRPGPVDEHDEPAAEFDEEPDMQHQPEPPGEDPGEPQRGQLHDGRVAPDGRQRAHVAITKWRCRASGEQC